MTQQREQSDFLAVEQGIVKKNPVHANSQPCRLPEELAAAQGGATFFAAKVPRARDERHSSHQCHGSIMHVCSITNSGLMIAMGG